MKAAVWIAPNKLEIKEIPEPKPVPGEIIIKVLGCGVCGTDCHIFAGHVPLAKPPQVLGHEIYGEVIDSETGKSAFKSGQLVCVDPVIGCGTCLYCHQGKTNLCQHPTIIGYARTGGFAQYTRVPQDHLYPMSEKGGRRGGILAETLACVLHGYDRLNLEAGKTVLILGAGCVGLLWTQLIKHSVATRLIQTEIIPYRGNIAKKLGADLTVDAREKNWQLKVRNLEPGGIDYIIDTTGNSQAIQQSLELLNPGGTFMIFGVCPADERVTVSPYDMFAKELTFMGSKMPPMALHRAVQIIETGLINQNALVTTTMPLEQLGAGIQAFNNARDKHIKIMIDPWI